MKEGLGHSNFQMRGAAFGYRKDGKSLTSEHYNNWEDREALIHAHSLVRSGERIPRKVKSSSKTRQLHQGQSTDGGKWDLEIEIGTSIENLKFSGIHCVEMAFLFSFYSVAKSGHTLYYPKENKDNSKIHLD